MGKRTLAGVAAGALGLALVPFVGVTGANATAYTGATTAVRAGAAGSIPYAALAFDKASAPPTALIVVTSPGAATMWVDDSTGGTEGAGTFPSSTDDSATLTRAGTLSSVGKLSTSGDDSVYGIAVDVAGSYIGQMGNGTDTVTFSFTTSGAPASMTLTPAEQTVLVGATAKLEVKVLDAAGKQTQIANGDSVTLATNTDDTVSPTSVVATGLYTGAADVTVNTANLPAGNVTVTATPAGTLPSLGLTAQTATVTKSGTVSSSAVVNMTVTSPTNAINNPVAGNSISRTTQVPANSATITVKVDDTTANAAGTQLRFGINLNTSAITAGAAVNGSVVTALDDTKYVLVTTDAAKDATFDIALSGGAINTGSVITVFQANVTGGAATGNAKITISQLAPAVYGNDISVSPDDSVVAQLGSTVPVTVVVDDSFGTPQSGWVVRAMRGTVIVSTGTTGSDGSASLSLTNAATAVNNTVESFTYDAYPPIGGKVIADKGTQVTWTTSGAITSLTVTANANTPTSLTDVSQTSTKGGAIVIPSAGVLSGAPTSVQFTIATGVDDTTVGRGNYAEFSATTVPLSAVTYTTPEGVFVTDDTTTATWANGVNTKTVSSGTSVYVYATKTGVHDITITSGDKTVTAKVKVGNLGTDAYNIALSPTEQSVGAGAIANATLTVTDIFGNPVDTSDGAGEVTVSASGAVLLAGFNTSVDLTTGTDGTATVVILAGNVAGTGTLAAAPTTGDTATAWQTTYSPPTGAPAPVTSAAATVTVASGPSATSIVITGERGTVRGKAGIIVDGLTQGLAEGTIVVPFIKFPGQTSYTQGDARRAVSVFDPADQLGEFSWQRRTGKKTYVYFATEDGSTRSSRIIIPAK